MFRVKNLPNLTAGQVCQILNNIYDKNMINRASRLN